MSTNNLQKATDKMVNEDSLMSNSTSNSFSDSNIQDLSKMKNIFLISKSNESRIIDILSYLQSDTNLANNKIPLLKYLQSLFVNVEFNSEIFSRKFINDKEKLNLFQIIIYQYILYSNQGNTKVEEDNYRSELHNLFILLLSKITLERETYHYILSFLIYYINEKNIVNAINKKTNLVNNDYLPDESIILRAEHLTRILDIITIIYKYLQTYNESLNYFFFSGESDSSIIIPNKENPKDHNKKILNLDDTLCIMLFIKVLPSEYIKTVYSQVIFRLLELRFNDKNKKNININIDIQNRLTTSYTTQPLYQLLDNEINCILIKFNNNKKKKVINSEIYVGLKKIELPPIPDENDKEKNGKSKDEIKEIVLFKNFIGICSNIIIYKEKKNEGTLPKFLFSSEDNNTTKTRLSSKDENNSNINNNKRNSTFSNKSLFPNGIYNEELFSYFVNAELKDQIEPNLLINNNKVNDEQIYKDFLNNNLISIYIPTRVDVHPQYEECSISNSPQIILRDAINNLDADFNTRCPSLNGVHTYSRIIDDFSDVGGVNSLLPIMEIMINNPDLLTPKNFSLYFTILSNFVFSPNFQNAIKKENNSNFFMSLSYFLEKIPNSYFNAELVESLKLVLVFLDSNDEKYYGELNNQFINYILMNEKILFKFNEDNQNSIINTICSLSGNKNYEFDIIKIIKILLNYDRKKNNKFCCKTHAEYFEGNYEVMDPELCNRIQPIQKLILIIFDKKYKQIQEIKNNFNNNQNKGNSNKALLELDENAYEDNNLYLLFYILTFDISPCIQKNIICLLTNIIEKYKYDNFIKFFDKKEELFDIVLFVFKTSIFDVKFHALNLLLLIEQNNNGKNFNQEEKRIFFKNHILPIFLLEEVNSLPTIQTENTKEDIDKINNLEGKINKQKAENLKDNDDEKEEELKKEETNKIENNNIINDEEKKNIIENVDINKIQEELKYEIIECKEELENKIDNDELKNEESKNKYGIRTYIKINGIKFNLFSSTDIKKKLSKIINKRKYNSLINNIYEKIINYLNDNVMLNYKLNLLIDIVSNGDLLLIQSFLLKIIDLIEEKEPKKKELISKELINNQYLLHWLLETTFQLYLLTNQGKDDKPFIPGFSTDIYKNANSLNELETPYDDEDKKVIINHSYKKSKIIFKFILNLKISNFDYILTWSKYYLKLKEENKIYNKIHDFIDDFIQESLNNSDITTFSEQLFMTNIKAVKKTLYYINMFFEFITYYKLEYNTSFFEKYSEKKFIMRKKISNDLKYILFNQREKGVNIEPVKDFELFDKKIDNYIFIRVVYVIFSPLWSIKDNKLAKVENEIYSKFIGNNKNSYIIELELLFNTFNDDCKNNDYCNKGIPLIIIIYHLHIIFLSIGGTINELKEYFADSRLLMLLLIIASSTLNSAETAKKKKWPKEEQYKEVQFTVECILFNFLFFFYHKVKELKKEIEIYKENLKNNTDIERKNLENLTILNRMYIENLGYLLKILNKIYRGVKNDENQKSSVFYMKNLFKNMFKTQTEGVKKSGPFLFIEKMYNECKSLNLNSLSNNNGNLRKTIAETSKYHPIDTLDKSNEKDTKKNEKEGKLNFFKIKSLRLGHNSTSSFSNYSTNPNPQSITLDLNKQKSDNTLETKDLNDISNDDNSNISEDKIINNSSNNKNTNNTNNNEENYLDNICQISFTQKEQKEIKEINLTDDNYNKLEKYINIFLNDKYIENFYEKHNEEYNRILYPFISIIEKRQKEIEKIIPIYDNRKNISNYPMNLCLVPYYYQENNYQNTLMNKMEEKNKELNKEIKLNKKKNEIEEYFRIKNYRDIKKKIFSFNRMWSYQDYFYDNEKYKLKYKLLNHMTNDFTKIFMTPIIDIDYYLPKFSLFKGEIFRNNKENSIIPITKTVDLFFGMKDKGKKKLNNNIKDNHITSKENLKENKLEISANSHSSFDSLNNSSASNISETKQDNHDIKQNIPTYELNQENYPYLKEKEIELKENENLTNDINIFNENDFSIFLEYIKKKHFNNKGKHCLFSEACLVKLPFHIRGIIYINNKEIGFYSYETKREGNEDDYDSDKKVCFGSVFKRQDEKYNQYYIKIPFQEIELIFKRRYYFKKNVLEIYTQAKKSFFFRIEEKLFKTFLDDIKYHLKNDLDEITIDFSRYEEKVGFINKNNILYNYNNYSTLFNTKKSSSIRYLYSKWMKWEVSTFTLLNVMNIYSSRSYNDINQYPVFPWIITDYTSKVLPNFENSNTNKNINSNNPANNASPSTSPDNNIPLIRPFNTPMGMMDITPDAKERKENYQEHWQSLETDEDKDENYDRYGSHYSTSLYLTYYLVRIFPFSYIRIELQGKNFDDPNRLFNSLSNSFYCAMTQKSDLRELIPEFFCLPEMFYNLNDLNLGEIIDDITKEAKLVNDIEIPPWAKGDAYYFVKKHRELLESIEINEKIHEWFNIIFGNKQKGKSAKAIGNLFIRQTYEDFDDIHKGADPNEKVYQKRMVEFGVTPSQLFKYDTYKRYAVRDLKKKPILFNFQMKSGSMWNANEELEIEDSNFYLEGTPYKIFSSLKKNEDLKSEKILFLYEDKIRIISKTNEKGFFKKNKTKEYKNNKSNKDIKNKDIKPKENKEIKNVKESGENKDIKEKEKEENKEVKEGDENDENNNKINNESDNEENNNYVEENEIKDDEEKNTAHKETISKYEKILICPKYRMNISQAPTLIYDKGNYIALGGFWNGHILINKLEEVVNKKDKNQKNLNLIFTDKASPIIHMKIDLSETFVICANKIGTVYIFKINKMNKGDWILYDIIKDNQKEITSIDLNENLNIFSICDKEGFINLYTLPQCKLFNSYKLNESIFPNNTNYNNCNRSASNINLYSFQNNIYADHIIISNGPLPSLILYIKSRKSLCIFSINFHYINEIKLGYEIVPNGIKKYRDYFNKDYIFIYNKNEKTIDVYDLIDYNNIARSSKINDSFIDFHFSKEMDHALIMVKINEEKKVDNIKDKNEQRNYKILVLKSPGREDVKIF